MCVRGTVQFDTVFGQCGMIYILYVEQSIVNLKALNFYSSCFGFFLLQLGIMF